LTDDGEDESSFEDTTGEPWALCWKGTGWATATWQRRKKRERKAEDFMMESLALDVRGELSCRTEADA